MERALASIQKVLSLSPIPGADRIEVAQILGWRVVCQKDLYNVGDLVTYLEVDSWVPNTLAPFLTKPGHYPKVFNEVEGERLKTVVLRKQLSQGLLLPMSEVMAHLGPDCVIMPEEGLDITDVLGIQKWEAPISAQLAGMAKGNFPAFIRKTDQTRIQSLPRYFTDYRDTTFEASVKLDGSSMTAYHYIGEFGVCSRNLNLKEDDSNSFWKIAHRLNLQAILAELGINLAIQGELIGEGIQGNPEKIVGQELRVFDIWDIDKQRYMTPAERAFVINSIPGIKEVPILHTALPVFSIYDTMDKLLEFAGAGPSMNGGIREGVVFKSTEPVDGEIISFKAINNSYLLSQEP